jgi:hypothetical protein
MTTFRKLPMQREKRVTVRYRSQGVERSWSREGIRGLVVWVSAFFHQYARASLGRSEHIQGRVSLRF